MRIALFLGLALLVGSARAEEPTAIVLTVKGTLTARGKPVADAQFALTPTEGRTAVTLEKNGRFEVKAIAARSYAVTIRANGHAPWFQTVDVDDHGVADLGAVALEPLQLARVTVAVGPRASLASAQVQDLELHDGACANVRARDDSGCRMAFCMRQDGAELELVPSLGVGQLRRLGKVSLLQGLSRLPAPGTSITGMAPALPLKAGETLMADLEDAYCAAMLHVDHLQ